MAVAGQNQAESKELERHRQAYILLIDSLLKKRVNDASVYKQKNQTLKQIVEPIQNTDDFLNCISDFAELLQLSEDQIGTYIGQNFLKALSAVEEQISRSAAKQKITSDIFSEDAPLLATLLSLFDTTISSPDRFVMLDNGAVKLVRKGKDILPVSANTKPDEVTQTAVGNSEDLSSTAVSESSNLKKTDSEKAAAISVREDQSIIAEILEKFGNVLAVYEPLVPKDFTIEQEQFEVEEAPVQKEPESKQYEASIIEEIITQFGGKINIQQPLIPKDSGFDSESFFDSTEDNSNESYNEDQNENYDESYNETGNESTLIEADFEPIQVTLTEFASIRNRLSEFQKTQDREGYQQFVISASDETKTVIALLNLIQKGRKQTINLEAELEHLSYSLPFIPNQLNDLWHRLELFTKRIAIINGFSERVRQSGAEIQIEVRKIWKPFLDLLNENVEESVMRQRIKILLLAIQSQVKPQIESGIMSLIAKLFSV